MHFNINIFKLKANQEPKTDCQSKQQSESQPQKLICMRKGEVCVVARINPLSVCLSVCLSFCLSVWPRVSRIFVSLHPRRTLPKCVISHLGVGPSTADLPPLGQVSNWISPGVWLYAGSVEAQVTATGRAIAAGHKQCLGNSSHTKYTT